MIDMTFCAGSQTFYCNSIDGIEVGIIEERIRHYSKIGYSRMMDMSRDLFFISTLYEVNGNNFFIE